MVDIDRKAGPCRSSRNRIVTLLLLVTVLGGCAQYMMPTPRIYSSGAEPAFETLDPELESNVVDVLFVTDREPEQDDPDDPRYGYGRSPSVAFGSAVVALGRYNTWEDVSAYSNRPTRAGEKPKLELIEVREVRRFPATPYRYQVIQGAAAPLEDDDIIERQEGITEFRDEVRRRLELTPRKDIFIFIHGVANKFPRAVKNAAQLWHFLGREGVPIAYTWPAGRGGLFGYGYDRESSEFTIFHLKQLAKILGSIPEVENVHVIAHSRGTDVALTALRELVIEARGSNADVRGLLKVDNVVLIAPDLDLQITMQRNLAESLAGAFGRLTVYASEEDNALGAAEMLFGSGARLGSTRPDELTEEQLAAFRRQANLNIIIYRGQLGGSFGHGYAIESPAVSSDLVALLRYSRSPGEENGRPLGYLGENFWVITDEYMAPRRVIIPQTARSGV